jgi:hypothetical protein
MTNILISNAQSDILNWQIVNPVVQVNEDELMTALWAVLKS